MESENELQFVYRITPTPEPRKLKVKLLFVPNTWQLAEAEIIGTDEDLSYLVNMHVLPNNSSGLLVAALSRTRVISGNTH